MHQTQRDQIMKLLNLDSMINEYLAEPNHRRKKNNSKNALKPGMNSLRNTNTTLDSDNKGRANSMNNLKKNKSNTISYRKDDRKCESTRKFAPPCIKDSSEAESQRLWKLNKYTLSDEKTRIPEGGTVLHKS